eukprot:1896049-Rhodomonas_salina.1
MDTQGIEYPGTTGYQPSVPRSQDRGVAATLDQVATYPGTCVAATFLPVLGGLPGWDSDATLRFTTGANLGANGTFSAAFGHLKSAHWQSRANRQESHKNR